MFLIKKYLYINVMFLLGLFFSFSSVFSMGHTKRDTGDQQQEKPVKSDKPEQKIEPKEEEKSKEVPDKVEQKVEATEVDPELEIQQKIKDTVECIGKHANKNRDKELYQYIDTTMTSTLKKIEKKIDAAVGQISSALSSSTKDFEKKIKNTVGEVAASQERPSQAVKRVVNPGLVKEKVRQEVRRQMQAKRELQERAKKKRIQHLLHLMADNDDDDDDEE
ncbi:MAG: hypothetical protein V1855_01415 [bacterium]